MYLCWFYMFVLVKILINVYGLFNNKFMNNINGFSLNVILGLLVLIDI